MSDQKYINLIEGGLSDGTSYRWALRASAQKAAQAIAIRFPHAEAVLLGLSGLLGKRNRGSFFGFPEGVLKLVEFRSCTIFLGPDCRKSVPAILVDFVYSPMGVADHFRSDIYFPEASDLADFSALGSPIENDAGEVTNGVHAEV